jgi:hypothetical protein
VYLAKLSPKCDLPLMFRVRPAKEAGTIAHRKLR